MKKLYILSLLMILGFLGALSAQLPYLSVNSLADFPSAVSPGGKYDISTYIHNHGPGTFTGNIEINFRLNGYPTSPGQPLTNVTIAPNDSILWSRTQYNYPNGMMNTGYNTVVVWPTSPQAQSAYGEADLEFTYTMNAAFKMQEHHVNGIMGAIANQSAPAALHLTTVNIGLSDNVDPQVNFYLTLNDEMNLLLGSTRQVIAPMDSISIDVFGFYLGKIIDDYWYPIHQSPVTKLSFWAEEGGLENSAGKAHFVVANPTGILAEELADAVSLYPNPAVNQLHVDLESTYQGQVEQMNVYNLAGQLVLQAQGYQEQLEVSQLPVGRYILEIQLEDQNYTHSFMKE